MCVTLITVVVPGSKIWPFIRQPGNLVGRGCLALSWVSEDLGREGPLPPGEDEEGHRCFCPLPR